MPGSMRLEDAAGLLSTDWEGESSTLGGFLVERIERLPRVGERLVIDGVRVEVEGMAGSTVASVLAVPATEQRGGEMP